MLAHSWYAEIVGNASDRHDQIVIAHSVPPDHFLAALVEQRRQARAARDFAASDRIRDDLAGAGVIVEDGAKGTGWRYR